MTTSHLHSDVATIAQEQGKSIAIKHYRDVTGKSLRRASKDVEMILWRNGIPSHTPPNFEFPRYINWHFIAFVAIPSLLGLLGAWGLIALFHRVFP